MSAVHYAVNQRTARQFRQYKELVDKANEKKHIRKYAQTVAGDIARSGKIKRERAYSVVSGIIEQFKSEHPANLVIRRDDIVTPSKLSSNFDPAISVAAGLYPGQLGDTEAFQINIVAARVSKPQVEIIDTTSGVQLNFHAIARLDEREIDKNPVYDIAGRLNDILTYTTLYQAVCEKHVGRNFAIPYNSHLLLGSIGLMYIPNGYHQSYVKLHGTVPPSQTEIGSPESAPLVEIRTAVSYNELSEQQDHLHDALVAFVEDNIEEINLVFEGLYCPVFVKDQATEAEQAVETLRRRFARIAKMPAWIRNQQNT